MFLLYRIPFVKSLHNLLKTDTFLDIFFKRALREGRQTLELLQHSAGHGLGGY